MEAKQLPEHFVSEPLTPEPGTFDVSRMSIGEPGLPRRFVWRGQTYEIKTAVHSWRETGPCRHGSDERYVRKHWYEVETTAGDIMTIYFDRHPRRGSRGPRWWLFSVREGKQREKR